MPNPPHWALNWCFGEFCTIWVHLGQFGCVTTLSAKRAKLVQMFVPRNRVVIFINECTRSTPLDCKLIFWCVLYYLGAFRTVWLPYKTPCKTGRSGAKVSAMKSCRNFLKRTFSIHPIGPQPHVLERFVLLGCIWDCLVALLHQCKTGQNGAKVRATKSRQNVSQWTRSIHPIRF